jgi:hypothetical protein
MENINDDTTLVSETPGSLKKIILALILVAIATVILASAIFIKLYKTGIISHAPLGELKQSKIDPEFYFIKSNREQGKDHKIISREVVRVGVDINQKEAAVYRLEENDRPVGIFKAKEGKFLIIFKNNGKSLVAVSLSDKSERILAVAEDGNILSDIDISVSGEKLIYLTVRGDWSMSEKGVIFHIIDFATGQSLKVGSIDLPAGIYSGTRVISFDDQKNELILSRAGGDGGGFWQSGYTLNLNNNDLVKFSNGGGYSDGIVSEKNDLIGKLSPNRKYSIEVYNGKVDPMYFDQQKCIKYEYFEHDQKFDFITPGTIILRDMDTKASTTIFSNQEHIKEAKNICLDHNLIGGVAWLDNENVIFTLGGNIYKISVLDRKTEIINYRNPDGYSIVKINFPYLLMSNNSIFNLENGKEILLNNRPEYLSRVGYELIPQDD